MIKLQIKPTKQLKRSKQSLYISFPYNATLISLMKTIPIRHYDSETREWEIHTKYFDNILDMFQNYDIEIIGELPKQVEKILDRADKYDEIGTNGFKFKTKPFDHQLEGFEFGINHRKFLLGDEQGLGKTKQSIDIAVARRHQFKHCLIVCCVNGLKWNWHHEITVHSNEKGHILGQYLNSRGKTVIGSVKKRHEDLLSDREEFFLITNIETLRDKTISETIKKLCDNGTIGMCIIDEIHKCKNSTSTQGKAIHKITSYYKMALTGTPLMNTPIDLYNILKWLDIEHHTLTDFKRHFCVMGGFGGYEITGYKHLNELQETLDRVMLRRKKEEVLDLPPKVRTTEYVEMTASQTKLYNDIKMQIVENIDKVMLSPNPLVELIRLRQCTGYPGVLSSEITESVKINRMVELVTEAVQNNEKVIVFSNWTSITDPAVKALHKFNPAVITGDTNDREQQEQKFQKDESCKVIVGTISAMGTGLTLTAGSTVIFLDSPWNRANKEQAEDRAHRIGTTKTVNIITLVAKDTIDERIESLVKSKGDIADMVVDNFNNTKIDRESINYLLS